jgi:hypothetical protein
MAQGSTKYLTEMSTKNLLGGKGRPTHESDLTSICEPIVWKMWELDISTAWASTACYRDSFTFTLNYTTIASIPFSSHSVIISLDAVATDSVFKQTANK